MLGLASAFTAPLLKRLGAESPIIHIYGGSSKGKTTALRIASSVYGKGDSDGYIQQWRTTDNALEGLASSHNDCLLVLDELGQADSKKIGDIAYMIANESGKRRFSKDSMPKSPYQWKTLVLSSGEINLNDKVAEGGRKKKAGMEIRFISIPITEIFSELHGVTKC